MFLMKKEVDPTPEPPFVPRERLIEKQKYFQSIKKPTYLKGPYDKITSVAIPIALATSSMYLVVSLFFFFLAFWIWFFCIKMQNNRAFLLKKWPSFWIKLSLIIALHFRIHNLIFLCWRVVFEFWQARGIYNMALGKGKIEWMNELCTNLRLSSFLNEIEMTNVYWKIWEICIYCSLHDNVIVSCMNRFLKILVDDEFV